MTRTPPAQGEDSERLRLRLLDVIDQLRRAERHLAAEDAARASSAVGTALRVARAAFDELAPATHARTAALPDDRAVEIVRAAQEAELSAAGASAEERFVGGDGRVVTFVRARDGSAFAIVSAVTAGRLAGEERFDSWRAALHAAGGVASRRSR